MPPGVGQHLASQQPTAVADAGNQHALRSCALHHRGVRHEPERQSAGEDREQQKHRIDDEDATREALESIQIGCGEHRCGAAEDDRTRDRWHVGDAERAPRSPVQAGR